MANLLTFWMVYGDKQSAPTVKHPTFEIAKQEAERLARAVPGVTFYVLRAMAGAQRGDVSYLECVEDYDY